MVFFGVSFTFLFAIALAVNFTVWYVSSLVSERSQNEGFLFTVDAVSLILRIPVAFVLAALPILMLLAER